MKQALVGIRREFPKAVDLKMAEGICDFLRSPWDMISLYQEIMFHGNWY